MRVTRVFVVLLALGGMGCTQSPSVAETPAIGSDPRLPPPEKSLIPTVQVLEATGWPEGAKPAAAQGLSVQAFATKLEHPRWVYVLPNGDVLVAESAAPPKPQEGGIKAWFMKKAMKKAGSAVKSADRITLLRDTDGDGVPETRSVFLQGLHSPFGMALVGATFYVANPDAVVRFPYQAGATRIDAPGTKVTDLPAGINHHWTKNLIPSRDGEKLYVTVGSNSNAAE
jgi:glucose/arabinose dehydrogenase